MSGSICTLYVLVSVYVVAVGVVSLVASWQCGDYIKNADNAQGTAELMVVWSAVLSAVVFVDSVFAGYLGCHPSNYTDSRRRVHVFLSVGVSAAATGGYLWICVRMWTEHKLWLLGVFDSLYCVCLPGVSVLFVSSWIVWIVASVLFTAQYIRRPTAVRDLVMEL